MLYRIHPDSGIKVDPSVKPLTDEELKTYKSDYDPDKHVPIK